MTRVRLALLALVQRIRATFARDERPLPASWGVRRLEPIGEVVQLGDLAHVADRCEDARRWIESRPDAIHYAIVPQ